MELEPEFLSRSMEALSGRGTLVPAFYGKLFEAFPEIYDLFRDADMASLEEHMLDTLVFTIHNIKHPDILHKSLSEIGQRHPGYGVKPEHFPLFIQVMMDTLRTLTGDHWTPKHEVQWREALNRAVEAMMMGYGNTEG